MNKSKKLLLVFMGLAFMIMFSACGTNPTKHTTKFSKIKGEWQLDSIYINSRAYSHATATEKTLMTIDTDKMTKVITSKKNGNSTKEYTIIGSDGKIEVQGGVTYTFNYDPGAEILHMYYTNSKGREVHEMYNKYEPEEQEQKKTDQTKNTDNTTDTKDNTGN